MKNPYYSIHCGVEKRYIKSLPRHIFQSLVMNTVFFFEWPNLEFLHSPIHLTKESCISHSCLSNCFAICLKGMSELLLLTSSVTILHHSGTYPHTACMLITFSVFILLTLVQFQSLYFCLLYHGAMTQSEVLRPSNAKKYIALHKR